MVVFTRAWTLQRLVTTKVEKVRKEGSGKKGAGARTLLEGRALSLGGDTSTVTASSSGGKVDDGGVSLRGVK